MKCFLHPYYHVINEVNPVITNKHHQKTSSITAFIIEIIFEIISIKVIPSPGNPCKHVYYHHAENYEETTTYYTETISITYRECVLEACSKPRKHLLYGCKGHILTAYN